MRKVAFRKVAIAGLCGSITHTFLMFVKTRWGILESFQPYSSLQIALTYWTGDYVHPAVPWLLSYLNGSTAAGFAFARSYRHLPGRGGGDKGIYCRPVGMVCSEPDFLSIAGTWSVRSASWPRLVAYAVLARDDADLQRRDGDRLQQD